MPQESAATITTDGSRIAEHRPVPQPRRLPSTPITPTAGLAYENVRIEAALNKSTPLNSDNLLPADDAATRPSKVPNKKVFLQTDADAAAADDIINGNIGLLTPDASPASTTTTPTRRVITEMNNLNLDHDHSDGHRKNSANKNFEESHKMQNMPVPAPRRLANNRLPAVAQEIYENNEQQPQQSQSPPQLQQLPSSSSPSSSSSSSPVPYKPVVQQASTGAISKTTRRAPQLPLPPPPKTTLTPPPATKSPQKINNNEQHSSPTMQTSSGVLVDGHDDDGPSNLRRNQRTTRSNVSLSSTTSGGSSTTGGDAKFAKGSPRLVPLAFDLISLVLYNNCVLN